MDRLAPSEAQTRDTGAEATQDPTPFDAAVFAGGGCRCFWQAGFWSVAGPALGLRPGVVAGVSAGAAFACAVITDTIPAVLEDFKRRARDNQRNAYPRNWLHGQPVFPHEAIYRGALVASLDDEAMRRLQGGPELRVLLARPAIWLGNRVGFLAGGIAYALDYREQRAHPRWGPRFGFRAEVISSRACRSSSELADAILQSSCTPPLLPLYRRGGRIVLDGGLIDNAPVALVAGARRTLVLMTRPFRPDEVPSLPGRTYLWPSRPVPVVKWDYTSPELIQQTFDLGRRDGERFAEGFRPGSEQGSEWGADARPAPEVAPSAMAS